MTGGLEPEAGSPFEGPRGAGSATVGGPRSATGRLATRLRDAEAATAIEYAIMVTLIATVIVFAVFLVGRQLGSDYDCTQKHVENTPDDPEAVSC